MFHLKRPRQLPVGIDGIRTWLALESSLLGSETSTATDWFGCHSDEELLQSVIESGNSEGYDPYTLKGMRQTLSVMLYG